MSNEQTEIVTLHSLDQMTDHWRLTCYQTPQRLRLEQEQLELAQKLQQALGAEMSVKLTWDVETLQVLDMSWL